MEVKREKCAEDQSGRSWPTAIRVLLMKPASLAVCSRRHQTSALLQSSG
jgi:hypothetical protein